MAALDAIMEVKQQEVEETKEGGETPAIRLIADPTHGRRYRQGAWEIPRIQRIKGFVASHVDHQAGRTI